MPEQITAERAPARVFDGKHGLPILGHVEIRDDVLVFRSEGGGSEAAGALEEWSVRRIVSVSRVGAALAVEIALEERHRPGGPSLQVHVVCPEFERALDEARAAYGAGGQGGGFLRRTGWPFWLIVALVAIPGVYWAATSLVPRLHVLIAKADERALGDAIYSSYVSSQISSRMASSTDWSRRWSMSCVTAASTTTSGLPSSVSRCRTHSRSRAVGS